MKGDNSRVIWFEDLARGDVALVGGKNASLGEMVRQLGGKGIQVPPGFATTAQAFREYLTANGLDDFIAGTLARLEAGKITLAESGSTIRKAILSGDFPVATRDEILAAFRELARRTGSKDLSVAARSSATAEDLPDASFAGQQETYLNVRGETALLETCRRCYASLFTDRAIITDHGGRTSHAAIVSQELGLPAVVGTGNATHELHDEQEVTISCAEGEEGYVYAGRSEFTVEELHYDTLPETKTRIMLNLANPSAAFRWWHLPTEGVAWRGWNSSSTTRSRSIPWR
jgi:phosphoenolpyruvate synthase/pyruvate phosphate dikinase